MSIISKINNWLWNQLFQYAIWRKLSIKNSTNLELDAFDLIYDKLRTFELNKFNTKFTFLDKNIIPFYHLRLFLKNNFLKSLFEVIFFSIAYKFKNNFFKEKDKWFDDRINTLSNWVYLSGYWQSEKYFNDIKDILLNDITPKDDIWITNKNLIIEIEKSNSVSIHFRRTDYKLHITNLKSGLKTCNIDYYIRAINIIWEKVKSPVYYIFSDNIDEIKKESIFNDKKDLTFKDNKVYFVNNNLWENSYIDLILMSKCKHNIIANSSFSWWGAWLNTNINKIVLAPKKRFSSEIKNERFLDIYCENRIKV